MSDTARNDYQTIEPAKTEGLEDLFEIGEPNASIDVNLVHLDANHNEQGANFLSVEKAALRLGISVRAVQKRLKKGTLSGCKQKTLNGERWFVEVNNLDASLGANLICLDAKQNEQDANIVSLDANEHEKDANLGEERDALVMQLQNKLEAASYRIGYLEAQLDVERNQVKLLTDSQHKPLWWLRSWQWFIGTSR
jgi:hypothetical protein